MYQLISFSWKYLEESNKYLPQMKWFDSETKASQIIDLPNFQFYAKLSANKSCTGYYSETGYHACASNTQLYSSTASQCDACERIQGFKSAFLMGRNPNSRMEEYLSQDHLIYIAYFEPGILKVGTVAKSRKFIRLIEQDALIYTFIAESSGRNIQKIERYISKNFNITETVKSSHKIKFLSQKPDLDKARDLINSAFNRIASKIDSSLEEELKFKLYKGSLEIIDISNSSALYFPSNFQKLSQEVNLVGNFKGIRGRNLIIENATKDYALDTDFLVGRYIDHIDEYTYNEENQLTLL